MLSEEATVTLWRPVGPKELDLIRASGMRAFPARLPEQPIFYPVLSEAYATRIARDWNVPASGKGYVARFRIARSFLDHYQVREAGGRTHLEYWIPAEDLPAFNDALVGEIEVSQNLAETPGPAMLRATEILRAGLWNRRPADVVRLDYDHRTRRRIALTGAGGLEFLLDLAKAPVLAAGDGLKLEDGRIVAVEAAPERLLEIACADERALARIAWHLGNRHLATEIGQRVIYIREDHVIAEMVRGLGAGVRAMRRAFNPEGGAYGQTAVHGHGHGHHHGDDHNHDGHGHSRHEHDHGH